MGQRRTHSKKNRIRTGGLARSPWVGRRVDYDYPSGVYLAIDLVYIANTRNDDLFG